MQILIPIVFMILFTMVIFQQHPDNTHRNHHNNEMFATTHHGRDERDEKCSQTPPSAFSHRIRRNHWEEITETPLIPMDNQKIKQSPTFNEQVTNQQMYRGRYNHMALNRRVGQASPELIQELKELLQDKQGGNAFREDTYAVENPYEHLDIDNTDDDSTGCSYKCNKTTLYYD
jgi:hypothetical protein